MQLSEIEREQLYAIVEKYDHHPDVQRMREYIQHGSVTTYQHCKNVALVSFWLNRRLHLHADETSLAVGALLHDFYLYDWYEQKSPHSVHVAIHPALALKNASERFELTPVEADIIRNHMWPLTPDRYPHSIEAFLVTLTDKTSAAGETFLPGGKRATRNALDRTGR